MTARRSIRIAFALAFGAIAGALGLDGRYPGLPVAPVAPAAAATLDLSGQDLTGRIDFGSHLMLNGWMIGWRWQVSPPQPHTLDA